MYLSAFFYLMKMVVSGIRKNRGKACDLKGGKTCKEIKEHPSDDNNARGSGDGSRARKIIMCSVPTSCTPISCISEGFLPACQQDRMVY